MCGPFPHLEHCLLVSLDLCLGAPMGRYFVGFLGRVLARLTANKAGCIPPCRIPCCFCTSSHCLTILFAFSNIRSGTICIRSDSALSLMPTMILFLINSSVKAPNSQLSAKLYTLYEVIYTTAGTVHCVTHVVIIVGNALQGC